MKELKDEFSMEKVVLAAVDKHNNFDALDTELSTKELANLSSNQRFHVDLMLTYVAEINGAFPTGPGYYQGKREVDYSVNQNSRRHTD